MVRLAGIHPIGLIIGVLPMRHLFGADDEPGEASFTLAHRGRLPRKRDDVRRRRRDEPIDEPVAAEFKGNAPVVQTEAWQALKPAEQKQLVKSGHIKVEAQWGAAGRWSTP